ncbi:MAG: phosphogluconate dehydratase [Paracoccaceae bacterium]
MMLNETIRHVTDRIRKRSATTRATYLERISAARREGPARRHLPCSGQAHAYAGAGNDQTALAERSGANLGIITAYNDMLSAHRPYEHFPDIIRSAARVVGATAQVAGGVPAMCDGVTQGQTGMELSLFSRDVIAMSAAVALSHDVYDAVVYLGVCDKIVPGLVIAAQSFGHLPAAFLPAGPMPSGLANDEKALVRQEYAAGEVDRAALMRAEMQAYHAPGTCTFFGTANTNQLLMEFMGLHLPGASFVPPGTSLRDALTREGAERVLAISALGDRYTPVADILDERAFVNAIVGLNATGGSTNLLIHLVAMARAGGIVLDWQDFADISDVTPLVARVYPNGLADVNHFHAAGGVAFLIGELLDAGLLHPDTMTIAGRGLELYTRKPGIGAGGNVVWSDRPQTSLDDNILRLASDPFQQSGGLRRLSGNLGTSVMKISAVTADHRVIKAPVRVFHDQQAVKKAFKRGELAGDLIVVVRFQGPRANGMPELHGLTPVLSILQGRGQKVALVTDGRMSGASGKIPAAIHVTPEALDGGPIARLQDGDLVRLDANAGTLDVLDIDALDRIPAQVDLRANRDGVGRELFAGLRRAVGSADTGASVFGD